MTITLVTTGGLVSGIAHTYAAIGDELYVAQGITWGSSNSKVINESLNDLTATFAGDVIAFSAGVSFSGNNASLHITATGSLTSFEQSNGNTAIHMSGTGSTLNNEGSINSSQSIGILSSGGNQIINRGTVDAGSAVFLGLFGASGDALVNSGHISANNSDDDISSIRYNNGVYSEGANTRIVNLSGGVITAVGTEAAGVRLGGGANGSTVENHGEIVSLNHYGVSFSNLNGSNTGSLLNTGVITGSAGAFLGSARADTVTNRGQMNGDVSLGADADIFDGRGGTVEGTVYGGAGDDTFIVDNADMTLVELMSEGTDTVQSTVGYKLAGEFENLTLLGDGNIRGIGNSEVNTLTGNDGDNRLRGKEGSDIINGGNGDDRIWGGVGLETVHGDAGEDVIHGGLSNDVIYGDDDNDVLYGNRHDDTLYGGQGDDRLIGGLGRDTLYGGQGEDEFVFNRKNDSLDTVDADLIKDFVIGEDLIDLSGLAGSHNYIGSAGFSGAVGEVQVTESGGTTTRVKIDLDGDGTADMKIMVLGTVGLTEADFLL